MVRGLTLGLLDYFRPAKGANHAGFDGIVFSDWYHLPGNERNQP